MNTTPKQIRLVNDCSAYHVGCQLVTREIRRKIAESGMIEGEPASLLLINGEGTLHHDSPNVSRIENAIEEKPDGAGVVLINATWQAMTRNLKGVSLAVARESRSASQMAQDQLAPKVITAPDISLCCQHRPEYKGGGGMIVVDSVSNGVTGWLKELASVKGGRFVRMCKWQESPEALIDLLATADVVVTGRFHGVVLAMLAGAPFLAAPSNTWKTRGMLNDLGLGGHYHESLESALGAVEARSFARVDRSVLDSVDSHWKAIFGQIAALEPQQDSLSNTQVAQVAKKPANSPACARVASVWSTPKSVVLVGNGPSLQGTRLGSIIDAHDEVVRFNNYRLTGFESDIGTKTTLWSTFGKGTKPADSEPPRRVICVHENANPEGNPFEAIRIPLAFYERLRTEIRAISKHPKATEVNPSSGLLVARWLLDNGCPHLNLAGFDHFGKERSKQHHYWNPQSLKRPGDHDGDAEKKLLHPFVMEGRLAYLC